jgi:hypothetical protein
MKLFHMPARSQRMALVLLTAAAGLRVAQAQTSSATPGISYEKGVLRVHVSDTTLNALLNQLAGVTGMRMDIPEGGRDERLGIVELGPGSAREVLAELLSESPYDYVIQSPLDDPGRIQSVLLVPRGKRGPLPPMPVNAAGRGGARGAAQAPPEALEPAPTDPVLVVQPDAPAAPDSSAPPSAPPPRAALQPGSATEQLNGARVAPQSPPGNLSQESIAQQLQQMYQQRVQINQQDRQASPAVLPPTSAGRSPGN